MNFSSKSTIPKNTERGTLQIQKKAFPYQKNLKTRNVSKLFEQNVRKKCITKGLLFFLHRKVLAERRIRTQVLFSGHVLYPLGPVARQYEMKSNFQNIYKICQFEWSLKSCHSPL